MSREHNENPMEDLLKAIFGEDMTPPEDKKQEKREVPTKTKGFESLVSEDEYKAILGIKEAVDKYIDVHNKNTIGLLHNDLSSSYAKVQYMMLCEVFDDLIGAVTTMYHVHDLDKDFIDDIVKESGAPSIEAFEHHMMMDAMMKKMLGK